MHQKGKHGLNWGQETLKQEIRESKKVRQEPLMLRLPLASNKKNINVFNNYKTSKEKAKT